MAKKAETVSPEEIMLICKTVKPILNEKGTKQLAQILDGKLSKFLMEL